MCVLGRTAHPELDEITYMCVCVLVFERECACVCVHTQGRSSPRAELSRTNVCVRVYAREMERMREYFCTCFCEYKGD